MTTTAGPRWWSLRKRLAAAAADRPRWSLRKRLVLAVVGLLAAVAIVIGTVSVLALSTFLTQRLDDQLTAATGRSQGAFSFGQPSALSQDQFLAAVARQAPGTLIAVVLNGTVYGGVKGQVGELAPLSRAQQDTILSVSSKSGPNTVSLTSLGNYRVKSNHFSNTDLITGLPLGDMQATLLQLSLVIATVTAVGLVGIAFAGAGIVRVALRPLERVVATTTRVAELPLDRGEVALAERVPDEDADPRTEVGQVGSAINRMLGHIAAALTARQESENKVRQFVADASHELRTPLASIRGYAELSRRGNHDLPDDVTYSIRRVESEATRMTSLVEDLLLLARLDEGRDLESKPIDLSRLLIDVVSDAHAAGPDHEWALDVPEEPVIIPGDDARLHQVFANLLANARVHTPAGSSVVVALGMEEDFAVVTVTDDGPGVPDEVKPVMFERFARADSSRSRAAGSTGLGLAIVTAVIQGHDGMVAVESEPGRTQFRVALPLETGAVARGEIEAPSAPAEGPVAE
ncbi:MAG: two-component sensor histidine kinase [Microbacteriaceae bacterium]|nr:two-component sensor histidine kinase [Microbacteriaceae bacterium]